MKKCRTKNDHGTVYRVFDFCPRLLLAAPKKALYTYWPPYNLFRLVSIEVCRYRDADVQDQCIYGHFQNIGLLFSPSQCALHNAHM